MKRNLSAGLNDITGARLDLFSEDSVDQLHRATLEVPVSYTHLQAWTVCSAQSITGGSMTR